MKILGIDPGTARTGYGLVRTVGQKVSLLDYGCIETSPDRTVSQRLVRTYREVKKIIRREKPHYVIIEKLFFFRNTKTVMTVSQSRGVVLLACEENRVPIFEYTPLEIKQTLSGYGRANKREIQKRVKEILRLKELPRPDDAADALAAALCYYLKKNHLKGELKDK